MNAMTSKERVSRFRLKQSIEKTVAKLQRLVEQTPEDLVFGPEIECTLIDVLGVIVGAPAEWVETHDQIGFRFMQDKGEEGQIDDDQLLRLSPEITEYMEWKERQAEKASKVKSYQKLTRNAFCEQVLSAHMANPRWGWVGVKETETSEPGALYLFAWEHNIGRDGEGTVGLFSKEVGLDKHGRRRAGHRDALEKIERVRSGELKPFVVWQRAVEPNANPRVVEGFNAEFVNACDLYIDEKGYWIAKLGEKHFLV
jgi:hypothetical protein